MVFRCRQGELEPQVEQNIKKEQNYVNTWEPILNSYPRSQSKQLGVWKRSQADIDAAGGYDGHMAAT